jgi:reverse gyrase
MERYCKQCGAPIEEDSRADKVVCNECRKEEALAYYAYSELRFGVWQFLRNHGPMKTREHIYNKMVDEEGMDWVAKALGEELIKAINE